MFQSSLRRLRALITLAEDVLGDPEPELTPHPHARRVRLQPRPRRPGAVPARPAVCVSPIVRPARRAPGRERVGR
jgi:hypothetical protein